MMDGAMRVLQIITIVAVLLGTGDGTYYDIFYPRGKDFSFTCPFKVEDTDLLTISRINVTYYSIDGAISTENPKPVYDTSGGGLTVGLKDTGRYSAINDDHHYTIYISKVQPEDSGTWSCQVKKSNGNILSGSYEKLIVLGAEVNVAFQRRIHRSRVDVYADQSEIDLTEHQLKAVAFVVNVSGLMAVRPNASITSCYDDGSSHNITSRLFHTSEVEVINREDDLVTGETYERFGGRSAIFSGNFEKTKGKVTLEGVYQYEEQRFTRSVVVRVLAPPIINPDLTNMVFDVLDDDTNIISTYVVAHPHITDVSVRLQSTVLNFTELNNNNNVFQKENVTLSIFKAEGKFYNWYNLTIKYRKEYQPGFYPGHSITVFNNQGSDTKNFYINQLYNGSSLRSISTVLLSLALILPFLRY